MSRRVDLPRLVWLPVFALATLLATGMRVTWLATAAPSFGPVAIDPAEIAYQRGAIWDRNGALLATETYDRYEVLLDTQFVTQTARLARELAPLLGESEAALMTKFESGQRWHSLESFASPATAQAVTDLKQEGLTTRANPSRAYPLREAAGHITGFVDVARTGHYGVEGWWNHVLTGSSGRRPGRYHTDPLAFVMPRDGSDLMLTIDSDLQVATWNVLESTVLKERAQGGGIIILDPRSGDILASVGWPGFDPNRFAETDYSRFNDPVIRAPYPPGSVLKPMTLAAAIDSGLLRPESTYEDTASIRFGGIMVPNPDRFGHGQTTMTDMLRLSLNVGAVHVASTLGDKRFYAALENFGFGKPTGIDLNGEHGGTVHRPGTAYHSAETFAFNSYGQGLDATLLQVASAIGALAFDGRRMAPRVTSAILPANEPPRQLAPRELARVVAPTTAAVMRRMMTTVVADNVTQAALPGFRVAGKTGTSEVALADGSKGLIASFCGFLPADAPEVVICVRFDDPDGVYGSRVAAPAFSEVAAHAVDILGIEPEDRAAWHAARSAEPSR